MNKYIIVFLLLLHSLSGCSSGDPDKAEIAKQQTQLFYSVINKDIDSALNLFDSSFFQDVSRENAKGIFMDIRNKFGPMIKYELVRIERGAGREHGKKINHMHLYYKTVYSSGFTSVERFVFLIDDKNFELIDGWTFYEWGKAPSV